jgi:hypothetical protein
MASPAPATQPTIACGPENVATISGIVMNGPIPTICVMLIAVAESKPTDRRKARSSACPAAASGGRGSASAESAMSSALSPALGSKQHASSGMPPGRFALSRW